MKIFRWPGGMFGFGKVKYNKEDVNKILDKLQELVDLVFDIARKGGE